ncbi:MAG: hypothetical protein JXB62_14570 [Pirellulales bacterium]|nr:hypothetical protein [Pirellulales bacterium]
MWRPIVGLGLVAGLVGVAYFVSNYSTEFQRDENGRLRRVTIAPRTDLPGSDAAQPPGGTAGSAVRIASFNLDGLDDKKLANRQVHDVLVRLLSGYDLVALQDVRAANRGVLVRLVDAINAAGLTYDLATAPGVLEGGAEQYSAFLLNTATIEIDRSKVHCVEDPAGRLRHKPLVAQFRVKGPKQSEAFTFKLINVHIDPARAIEEIELLDDVYRAIRDDRPREDDILMLGDFAAGYDRIGPLGTLEGIAAAVTGTPTNLRGTSSADNIYYDRKATVEFTGRSGVFDVMRQLDLTLQEALQVSEHLPVWAEYTSLEGGYSGYVAGFPGQKTR